MRKDIVFAAILMLVFNRNGFTTNYYCSPSGSMADSGTSVTSPWNTLQEVFSAGKTFIPGDTVYLLSGNHGYPVILGINTGDVVIRGYENNNPIVNCIDFNGASHWILENVRVNTPTVPPEAPILEHPVYPLSNNTLVRIMNSSSHISLSNCYIYSIENTLSWTADDWNYKAWNGVLVEGSCNYVTLNALHIKNTNFALELLGSNYTTVTNSLVENFCGDGIIPGNNNVIEYNTFRDSYKTNGNHCDMVQAFYATNILFRGNILLARTQGHSSIETDCQGIGFFDGTFKNCILENNVISVDTYHGITIFNAIDCKIINNTLADMAVGGLVPWINITGSGNLVRNNISSMMNTIEGTSDHNLIILRSKYGSYFVDPDNQDYHLKAWSPAIDAGIDTDAPDIDLDKNERPRYAVSDLGAYEYYEGPDTLSPTTPALLSAINPGPSGFTLSWATSTDNIRVSGYDVFVDGILDTTVTSNTVIFTGLADSTTYTLSVMAKDASNNFSAESDPIQGTTLALSTGIKSDPLCMTAIIYPNPVDGEEFTIRLKKWQNREVTVEIIDDGGKTVFSQPKCSSDADITIKNTFKRGFFVIRITDGQTYTDQKLLIY